MDIGTILLWLACAALAYLIGSVSFAYIVGIVIVRRDIRKYGSGNAGASNMTRNFGWKMGLLTFAGDIVKGSIAVLLTGLIAGNTGMCIAAVCAVVGHNWPVYFGFRGGKGIATTLGVALVLMGWHALAILGIAGVIIITTRIVSIGSLTGALLLAAASFAFYPGNLALQICCAVLFALAVIGHRENIKRLFSGTENRMTFDRARPRKRRTKKVGEQAKNNV